MLQETLARLRHLDAVLLTEEQPAAEFLFKRADLTADRRLGDPQFPRRRRETAFLGDRDYVSENSVIEHCDAAPG